MTDKWSEYFQPISAQGWSIREGQQELGNAIIATLEQGGTLVGEASTGTGKSVAAAVPLIKKIQEAHKNKETYRAAISTETLTLQRQLDTKDLPFLQKLYGGFTFKKLMGRSNYVCFNRMKEESVGNPTIKNIFHTLDARRNGLGNGEKSDVERVLGKEISQDTFSRLCGATDYCADNKCEEEDCYSMKARAEALKADIVVCNHAILAIDFEMKQTASEDGMLGPINAIVVDEAHTLEDVLSNQWTEKYTEWEIHEHLERFVNGVAIASSFKPELDRKSESSELLDSVVEFFDTTKKFFSSLEDKYGNKWEGSENAFCMKFVTAPSPRLRTLMNDYESLGPAICETILNQEATYNKLLMSGLSDMIEPGSGASKKDKANVRKALTSLKYLVNMADLIGQAMDSRDGIVKSNGITYGLTISGWVKKTGEQGMTIRAIPIDLSSRASKIWLSATSSILISATLQDLTARNFKYFKRSLGIPHAREIKVASPFLMHNQQLVYVSDKVEPPEDGTVFSVEEIVKSVEASQGRALILFTSRRDLEMANQKLLDYKIAGRFPYVMYVQTPDADKSKLVEDFKNNTFSVLLGLKSMFTGIDIPGSSLSNVIICRFPLSRYSVECKMKIQYWRENGFPNWYSRDSLTVFQQAAGRLIRSEECIGVVSILDQRVSTANTTVYKTAKVGIESLGSRVTWSLDDVRNHLGEFSAV